MQLHSRNIFLLIFCLLVLETAIAKPTIIPEVSLHTKISQKTKQDGSIQTTHFTRKEIKASPVTNLSELLKQQQSIVRVTNAMNGNQAALSIRGFGDNAASNSLILVDGFPLANFSLQAPNFNAIALSNIERIDIMQGSQGSLWGDQAVGGVVNIITRHPEFFIGDINVGLGSFKQHFYNVLLGSKFANGFYFKSFGFTQRTDNYRQHNKQKNDTIFLQTGFDYARGTLGLSYQVTNNTIFFPGSLTQTQYDTNPAQAVNFSNFSQDNITNLQLINKHALGTDWILETRLSHQQLDSDGVITSVFNSQESDYFFNPRLIGNILGTKLTLGYAGQSNRYQFDNTLFHDHVSALQNNVYAQVVIPWQDQVDVTLGARIASQNNDNSINHVGVTEQGIAYHPSDEWQFYLRRDGNFRFPKANEQTWLPQGVTRLAAQTGVSYEAGMIWQTARQKAQLNIYRLQLKHEIGFDPTQTVNDPLGTYQNFPETRRDGITLAEYIKFTPQFIFNTQLNYVQPHLIAGVFSGNTIPAVPTYTANAGVDYVFHDYWRASYTALYTGSRYASLDFANVGRKLSGYWLNTITLQYVRKLFDISFQIENVGNQKYATYTLFNPTTQTYAYYPGAGRSFLFTFKTSIDE